MILKKLHSPILVLLTLFMLLQSCEKKPINKPNKKGNLTEIDRLIDLVDKHFENVKYDSAYYYHNKQNLSAMSKRTIPVSLELKNSGILPYGSSSIEKRINRLKIFFKANNNVHLIAIAKDLGLV